MGLAGVSGTCGGVLAPLRYTEQVLHLRDQITLGMGVVDKFMERRCLILCSSETSQSTAVMLKRVVGEAAGRFGNAALADMHHVGFIDMTKYGRMTMLDIDDCAKWASQVLALNEDRSSLS